MSAPVLKPGYGTGLWILLNQQEFFIAPPPPIACCGASGMRQWRRSQCRDGKDAPGSGHHRQRYMEVRDDGAPVCRR
jgi:hypothetical protein